MADTVRLLRVRNWNTHYEINRTRSLKSMVWFPVPNRLDNDGYIELVSHPNGASHLGVWISNLQVASRCKPRGTLVRDDGTPHTSASLARLTRIPVSVLDEAIPRLLTIGWLEVVQRDSDIPQLVAVIPQVDAVLEQVSDDIPAARCDLPVTTGNTGNTGNTGKQEYTAGWDAESAFQELWDAYPAKGRVKRPLSQQYFCDKVRSPEAFQAILGAVNGKWARSEKWAKGFIMALPSFLDQESWLEDPPADSADTCTPQSTMDPETARRIAEARVRKGSSGPTYRRWEPPKMSAEDVAASEAWLRELELPKRAQ